MKYLSALFVVLLAVGIGFADDYTDHFYNVVKSEPPKSICPVTKMGENCMMCHAMMPDGTFGLREIDPNGWRDLPSDLRIIGNTAHIYISDIYPDLFVHAVEYINAHPEIEKLVIEIHSPGGSVMGAWRIIGYINELRERMTIETRCYGMAASAGFILFISGDIGNRHISPTAETMVHELRALEWIRIATPSQKSDEAEVFEHFQENMNNWIVSRCLSPDFTKEFLSEKIEYKDFWMTGLELVEFGCADHFIGEDPVWFVTEKHERNKKKDRTKEK